MGILKGGIDVIRDTPPILLDAAWETCIHSVLLWVQTPVPSRLEEVCLVAVVLL